ncbi:hypothetical protein PHSY_003044 [Pseudozyma hubeiensis SY62]|uniref:Uncharacterized protein n=1 Tax=Pseudozyma hubeiensis (strain SY62) TaxID=1305764 RepID=R9P272_PSEHS|nr:hypothetical protein PHSY_003044 [Pseudozyma hubeiensis SY62]GAC95468.1 hypothetical protein PHSY_003044 [Pseudozyma hubeiensis SY62]
MRKSRFARSHSLCGTPYTPAQYRNPPRLALLGYQPSVPLRHTPSTLQQPPHLCSRPSSASHSTFCSDSYHQSIRFYDVHLQPDQPIKRNQSAARSASPIHRLSFPIHRHTASAI